MLGIQVGICQICIGFFKLVFLIAFGIVCSDHSQTGQVFTCDCIETVCELLHDFELRYGKLQNDDNRCQHQHNGNAGSQRPLPCLSDDLKDGPYCHDRCPDQHLQA